MKPLPLRTSLTVRFTALLAVVLTAVGLFSHVTLRRQLDADVSTQLQDRSRALEGYLQLDGASPTLVYDRADPGESAFIDDVTDYYRIYDADTGRLLAQSAGFRNVGLTYTAAELADLRRHPGLADVRTERGRLRVVTTVLTRAAGHTYLLQVGDPLDGVDTTLAGFDRLLLWQIVVGLVLALVVGRSLAMRGLAPLAHLATSTETIDIGNLHTRLAVRGTDDEADRVAGAFNLALARVERAVDDMRQFSAALAHELRTPLAILRGEAELALRQSASPDAMRQTLARQIDELDRLARLINQILTLARAEAGDIALARTPVDMSALGASVVDQLEGVASARGVSMTFESAGNAVVTGDAGWLERLLVILLDNALKFTREGGCVSLHVSRADESVRLTVRDNGVGIPAHAVPRLFERFFRVDGSRASTTEGAGLGLALARWIAERHDGRIGVTSEPDRGSVFVVTIPGLRRTSHDAGPPASARRGDRTSRATAGRHINDCSSGAHPAFRSVVQDGWHPAREDGHES